MTQADEIVERIAQAMRAARAASGLSRRKLAEAAQVSERYLNDLEKGEANVSIGVLARLAEALGLTVTDFISAPREEKPVMHAGLARLIAALSPAEQNGAEAMLRAWLDSRRRDGKGIALLGLRGAGKSTLGRMLAEKHGLSFVSVTREIETRAGMNLADLFNLGGAEAYRSLENAVATDLARRQDRIVVETAGGIVGNSEAMEIILGAFRTVWLKARPEEHLSRVARQGDTRPMDGNPRALDHLKALLAQREPDYARADAVLDTSGRSEDAALAELERIAAPALTPAARAITSR